MTNLSSLIKNGQQLKALAGAGVIAVNDILEIGGPGNQAWSVACADYAAVAAAGAIANPASVATAAMPYGRQPLARDRFGNIYQITTNSSGRLVAYKMSSNGTVVASAVLDSVATSINNAKLFQLSNGSFACVYARASGALFFVIFDAGLSLIAGPTSVASEYASTNLVYHSVTPLSGGGFAIAYQTTAGTSIQLATYSNAGATVTASTNIQTLAGSAAIEYLDLRQLSNGNLVCAYRGTMTASSIAGTNFTIVTPTGSAVAGPTNMDTTATFGIVEISVLPGYFALAEANGTNLIAGVFSNAGAQQGSNYSVGNTLNNAYPQTKIVNDGTQFWLVWFSSAANGLYAIPISTAGVSGLAASALGGAILNAATFALDATCVNGLIAVLAASSATGGQYLAAIGLPDASQGILVPYLRFAPTAIGTAAGTTGSVGPRILSGGQGFYAGANPPNGQPSIPTTNGDWTVIMAWDQQNTAGTFMAIQKLESSAIIGVSLAASSTPGQATPVNPGTGEYISNQIGGTSGLAFNHLSATPGGCQGYLFPDGVALSGLAAGISSGGGGSGGGGVDAGVIVHYGGGVIPGKTLLNYGQAVSRTLFPTLFAKFGTTYGSGDGSTTFNLPDERGRVRASLDNMGGSAAGRLTSATMSPNGSTLGATGGTETVTVAGTTGTESFDYGNVGAGGITVAGAGHTHNYSTTVSNVQPTILFNGITYTG